MPLPVLSQVGSDLADLKSMFEHPRLFIASYYSELCARVDIEFEKYMQPRQDYVQKWSGSSHLTKEKLEAFIESVQSFRVLVTGLIKQREKEILDRVKSNFQFRPEFFGEVSMRVSQFELMVDQLKVKDRKDYRPADFENLYTLDEDIYACGNEVQKILFGNETWLVMTNPDINEINSETMFFEKMAMIQLVQKLFIGRRGCIILEQMSPYNDGTDGDLYLPYDRSNESFYTEVNELFYTETDSENEIDPDIMRKKLFPEALLIRDYREYRLRSLVLNCDRSLVLNFRTNMTENQNDLSLFRNGLTHVDQALFNSYKNLMCLILRWNFIRKIPVDLFKNLKKLVELDLSYNRIYSLDSQLFHGLNRLIEIDLRGNQLKTIPSTLFMDLHCLKRLYLGTNKISSLELGFLDSLVNLKELDLSKNKLVQFDVDLFKKCKNLVKINLSQNLIEVIRNGLLEGLVNLRSVNFSNNRLGLIEVDAFCGLKQLKCIDLNRNKELAAKFDLKSLNGLSAGVQVKLFK